MIPVHPKASNKAQWIHRHCHIFVYVVSLIGWDLQYFWLVHFAFTGSKGFSFEPLEFWILTYFICPWYFHQINCGFILSSFFFLKTITHPFTFTSLWPLWPCHTWFTLKQQKKPLGRKHCTSYSEVHLWTLQVRRVTVTHWVSSDTR